MKLHDNYCFCEQCENEDLSDEVSQLKEELDGANELIQQLQLQIKELTK